MNPLLFAVFIALQPNSMPEPSYKAERIALYVTAAADVLTTRLAIINGAHEGNPAMGKILGRTPSTLKLVAAKAVSIAITEWAARYHRTRGNHRAATFLYWFSAFAWGYASGFNLRFAWT